MGYHTESDIPNYWTYAKDFVLQDHMFEPERLVEPAGAPVPGVGVVGVLHPARQPVELLNALQTTHAERPANAPADLRRQGPVR